MRFDQEGVIKLFFRISTFHDHLSSFTSAAELNYVNSKRPLLIPEYHRKAQKYYSLMCVLHTIHIITIPYLVIYHTTVQHIISYDNEDEELKFIRIYIKVFSK
jgi:hypothetical protein